MNSLSANTLIESSKLNENFQGLSDGTFDEVQNSLETSRLLTMFDHVASGGIWTGDSYGVNRNASMTSLIAIIGGKYVTRASVSARTFTASKDTYVDLDNAGTLTYTEVSNNAASPSLAANSIRIAIIITGASTIADSGSINQGQQNKTLPIVSSVTLNSWDSLGNVICNRSSSSLRRKRVTLSGSGITTETIIGTISVPALPFRSTIRLKAVISIAAGAGAPVWGYYTRIRLTNTSGTELQKLNNSKTSANGIQDNSNHTHETEYQLSANTSQVFVCTLSGSQSVDVNSSYSSGLYFYAEIDRND